MELVAPCSLEKPHKTHLNISIALVFLLFCVMVKLFWSWLIGGDLFTSYVLWSMSRTVQTIRVKVVFCFPYTTLFTYQCHGQHGYHHFQEPQISMRLEKISFKIRPRVLEIILQNSSHLYLLFVLVSTVTRKTGYSRRL